MITPITANNATALIRRTIVSVVVTHATVSMMLDDDSLLIIEREPDQPIRVSRFTRP